MFSGKIKFGKIAIVVFITILIWVYADLALDDEFTVPSATVSITRPAGSTLWVSFEGETSSIQVDNINLSGPASKISQFRQALNDGNVSLNISFLPEKQGIREEGNWPISIISVIGDSELMREWGLMVESSDPDTITVAAMELVPKRLAVVCVDENGNPLTAQKIEPPEVEILVPKDWVGDALVRLTSVEARQARSSAVDKAPFVRVGQEIWIGQSSVKVLLPQDTLKEGTVQNVTLGITYSLNMQGRYRVEVENLTEVIGQITVQTTPQAREDYANMRYQVILEIDDRFEGEEPGKTLEQPLIYNLPTEHVRKGEIAISPTQAPVNAKFKLIPITSEPGQPVEGE
ncbi:MAG: hypothetical protein ACYSSP_01105 [Planctomycetota bacterium]|jgi:hypothetical protein